MAKGLTSSKPRTEAGQALVAWDAAAVRPLIDFGYWTIPEFVAAIEAESSLNARARRMLARFTRRRGVR